MRLGINLGVEGGGLGLGCAGFRLVEIFNKIMGFFMRFEEDSVESAKIVNPVECEDHLDSLSAMICLSECLPSLLRFNLLTFIFNCISRTLYLPLRL
ncbi:hypothetical protein EV1_014596 [Malus domestica]